MISKPNFPLQKQCLISLCFIVTVLYGCGGGGGGGGGGRGSGGDGGEDPPASDHPSDLSVAELQANYDRLRNDAYPGQTFPADLSLSNLPPYMAAILSFVGDFSVVNSSNFVSSVREKQEQLYNKSTKYKDSLSRVSTVTENTHSLILLESVVANEQQNKLLDQDVDDETPCTNGGTIHLQGRLDDSGIGALALEYRNCMVSGATINGNGALRIFDQFQTHTIIYYDAVVFSFSDGMETVTGSIERQSNAGVFNTTSNVYIATPNSEFDLMLENFVEQQRIPRLTSLSGNLYLPDRGFVSISTETNFSWTPTPGFLTLFPSDGLMRIVGDSNTSANIVFRGPFVRLLYDQTGDGVSDLGATYSGEAIFQTGISLNEFTNVELLNYPPLVSQPEFVNSEVNTTNTIDVLTPTVDDFDGDQVSLTYRWRVNDVVQQNQTTNTLPAFVGAKGNTVSVTAIANDGVDSTTSLPAELIVGDAPATIIIDDYPNRINVGESLEVTITHSDPDPVDIDIPVLRFGPAGMVLVDGILQWTAENIFFAPKQTYFFSVEAQQDSTLTMEGEIEVVDPNASLPKARSGMQWTSLSDSVVVGDYDRDGNNEILITTFLKHVMTLEERSGVYRQDWLYPFAINDEESFIQALSGDFNGDGRDDPLLVTRSAVYLIGDENQEAEEIYRVAQDQEIASAAVENLDLDDSFEIALLVSDNSLGQGSEIRVVDMESGEIEWSLFPATPNFNFKIGNVDADPTLEIVLSGGSVYDVSTQSIQWNYSQSFGFRVLLGDIDGDGIDEIVSRDSNAGLTFFDAVSESIYLSLPNYNPCAFHVENIDADIQEEVIVGECTSEGEVTAIDVGSGSELVQWVIGATGRPNTIVVGIGSGDSDDDGEIEVFWGNVNIGAREANFAIADVDLDPINVWYNDEPVLDSFTAAGWGDIEFSDARAVFVVPQTDFITSGQRIATMSFDGMVELSDEISPFSSNPQTSSVFVDYDGDTNGELLFRVHDDSSNSLQVRQLVDDAIEFESGGILGDSIGFISSADINFDSRQDAIYFYNNRLVIEDIFNQEIIWTSPQFSQPLHDFSVGNIDSDADLEILISSDEELMVFDYDGNNYSQSGLVQQRCHRLAIIDLQAGPEGEIVCVSSSNDRTDPQTGFWLYNSSLNVLNNFQFAGHVGDLLTDSDFSRNGNLLIGYSPGGSTGPANYSRARYGLLSIDAGRLIWHSPDYLLSILPRSAHFFSDSMDVKHLTFGTVGAMYVTQ